MVIDETYSVLPCNLLAFGLSLMKLWNFLMPRASPTGQSARPNSARRNVLGTSDT